MFQRMCERVSNPAPVVSALALVLLVFLSACNSDDSTTPGDGSTSGNGTTSGNDGSTPADGSTSGDDTLPLDDPILAPDTPSAPGNIRGVAYTETEIEIFWERADDSTDVVAYQIRRDGELLETRDGLSFYENQLTPSTTLRV